MRKQVTHEGEKGHVIILIDLCAKTKQIQDKIISK